MIQFIMMPYHHLELIVTDLFRYLNLSINFCLVSLIVCLKLDVKKQRPVSEAGGGLRIGCPSEPTEEDLSRRMEKSVCQMPL